MEKAKKTSSQTATKRKKLHKEKRKEERREEIDLFLLSVANMRERKHRREG